jgi:hypothetical protein
MRVVCALSACVLALVAVLVSILDDAREPLAFFSVAAVLAAIQAWSVREPYMGGRRVVGIGITFVWLMSAVWIGLLLLIYQPASRPPPEPEATYLGLTATFYHLLALYGGSLLVTIAGWWPAQATQSDRGAR